MTTAVTCPRCRAPIEPTWDWCHACGFDPEGLKPATWEPPTQPPAPRWPVAGAPAPPAEPPKESVWGAFGTLGKAVALCVLPLVLFVFGVLFVMFVARGPGMFSSTPTTVPANPIASPMTLPALPALPPTVPPADVPWQPWTSPNGWITVDVPAPMTVLPTDPSPKFDEIAAESRVGGARYRLDVLELKPEYGLTITEDEMRTRLIDALARELDMEAGPLRTTTFAGIRSADADLVDPARPGTTGTARIFLIGKRLYGLSASSVDGSHDFARFADSLHAN